MPPIDPNTPQPQSSDAVPGLYQMAMAAGADMNPQTGGAYDPLGLLGGALQYHGMFDPSGAEDRIRTANTLAENPNYPVAPWVTQPMQGQQAQDTNFSGITAGAAPKYGETGSENVFPSIFSPRAPRSGWFNLQDYYKGAPEEERRGVPSVFSTGSNALSTNDWRLLPSQYRNPNYFMVNGRLIDRSQAQQELSPGSYMGAEVGPTTSYVNRGSSGAEGGFPRVYWSGWDAHAAFPGQLGGRSAYATTNY